MSSNVQAIVFVVVWGAMCLMSMGFIADFQSKP